MTDRAKTIRLSVPVGTYVQINERTIFLAADGWVDSVDVAPSEATTVREVSDTQSILEPAVVAQPQAEQPLTVEPTRPPACADGEGLAVSIRKFIAEIDGYASREDQRNDVSRKFAVDALRLSRDPQTVHLARRRYAAAREVLGMKEAAE